MQKKRRKKEAVSSNPKHVFEPRLNGTYSISANQLNQRNVYKREKRTTMLFRKKKKDNIQRNEHYKKSERPKKKNDN